MSCWSRLGATKTLNLSSLLFTVGQSALDSRELLNKSCPKEWPDEDSFVEMHSDYPD